MKTQRFHIILLLLSNLVMLSCKSQNSVTDKFNYYKIDLKSEETDIAIVMRNNYKKEFYHNENLTIFKNQNNNVLELIYFYKNGRTERHLFKNNEHFVLKNSRYIDESLSELSDDEKEQLQKMYVIEKQDIKIISESECFKITLKSEQSPEMIEMYVSNDIPNLPYNFPLPSYIYNGEPLEIKISIFSEIIEFGVMEFLKNIKIEDHLGLPINNPKEISESEYNKLKE
jgi:hypothetical protein